MAGRGRGRGFRMSFGFDPERRENPQQQTMNQPNPLYPAMSQKPLPLVGGDSVEYLLALKQELRGAARSSNSFITAEAKRREIQRYSDKYHQDLEQNQDYRPDWSMFPKELRVRSQKPRPSGAKAKSAPGQTVKKASSKPEEKTEILLKLETLEQKEKVTEAEEEEEEEEKKAEEEEAEEEQLDEDDFEEETDYIMSYFDNGEEFGADSDDNMDEAIY